MNATLAQRVYAILIDMLLTMTLIFGVPALLAPLGLSDSMRGHFFAGVFFLTLFAYEPWLVFLFGQTLGHRVLGIKVVRQDGGRVALPAAYLRFVVKAIGGILSLATMMGARQLALKDIITKTKVVALRS